MSVLEAVTTGGMAVPAQNSLSQVLKFLSDCAYNVRWRAVASKRFERSVTHPN